MDPRRLPPHRAADLAVAVLVVLFAILGIAVHNSISGMAEMGRGIRDTGLELQASGASTAQEIRKGVGSAADAISAVPLVGGQTGTAVRRTGQNTAASVERESREAGRRLVVAGQQGERDALSTARLIGFLAFFVPTVLLLAQWLPKRLIYVDGRWRLGTTSGARRADRAAGAA